MDFAYHATATPEQWDEWAGRNAVVEDDGLTVEAEPTVGYRDAGFEAVDIAVDRDGTVYALRASGDVYRHGRRERPAAVWTDGAGETVEQPQALCLAGDRVFVADGAGPALVVVSEREGRAIGRIETDVDDLRALVTGDRTLYILDGGPPGGDGRVATLRRRGAVGTAVRGLESPRDLTVDPDGNVAVLEVTDDGPRIGLYEARYVASPDAFPDRRTVETFPADADGGTLVPECLAAPTDEDLIVHGPLSTSGDPALYHYRLEDGTWERRHGLDARCSRLRADPQRGNGRYPTYYGVAAEGDRVYAVEETKKYRRNPDTGRFTATAFRRFDAGSVDTQWHRLALGFEGLDSNTQVLVSYSATDGHGEAGIETVAGVNEHDAADLRGAGIESVWDLVEADPATVADAADGATVERAREWVETAVGMLEAQSDEWTQVPEANPDDTLLSEATGRYLRVRLELVGDADTAPTVGSLRAYCPRRTYLRYLPALFREDRRGELFLEQFLSTFETANTGIEEEIERLAGLFDPEGVPNEYLSWLGEWLAIETGEDWPEPARREFLDRAPELFAKRGTRAGIADYVGLYLDHVTAPDTGWILEWQRRRVEDRRAAGHLTEAEAERRHAEIDALAGSSDGGGSADGDGVSGDENGADGEGGHHLFVMERLDLDGIDSPAAREPYTMHMPGPRSFAVFVGPFTDPGHREAVEELVAREKPAHTDGHVVPMRQHVKLEGNSFLGVNTTLTPREFVLGRATLGEDSVLTERDLL